MQDDKTFISKVNPVIQFFIILTITSILIVLSKFNLFSSSNDWNLICLGVLLFICFNALIGIFQTAILKYVLLSITAYIVFILSFLFMGKFGWIDSIKTTQSQQLVIMVSSIFYIIITVITQLIRLLYIHTQDL